ncbi:MAG TPA: histidine kinase dimerization/phospho-acceptor domain-containing protein [Dongiaceae bacterium]|nr:histidine kinase dimerization/phospho-acceptor domain-containing protein [Dongiaceae bacterium]
MREESGNCHEIRNFGELLRHELNNPLTGILGNAELLLVEMHRQQITLPEEARSRLETIAALAVRMRETVRQLSEDWQANALDFSTQPTPKGGVRADYRGVL